MQRLIFVLVFVGFAFSLQAQSVPDKDKKTKKSDKKEKVESESYISIDTSEVILEEENTVPDELFIIHDDYINESYDTGLHPSNEDDFPDLLEAPPEDDHDEEEDYEEEIDTLGLIPSFNSKLLNPLVKAILADSAYWIGVNPFYASFDTLNVNPYRNTWANIKDTITIQLHDTVFTDPVLARLWAMPLNRIIVTSHYGPRWSRWHHGTDLDVNMGDSVFAVFDGVVRISKYNKGGYGNYVLIRHHNGLETLYGHMDKRGVRVGEVVKAGQFIGYGGNTGRSTGPHLHFEVRYQGISLDPEIVFDFPNKVLKKPVLVIKPSQFKHQASSHRKGKYHRIRSGDTLSTIARKYRVSVRTLCKLNRISTRTKLRVGKVLRVR